MVIRAPALRRFMVIASVHSILARKRLRIDRPGGSSVASATVLASMTRGSAGRRLNHRDAEGCDRETQDKVRPPDLK